jgi:hypothetical protein
VVDHENKFSYITNLKESQNELASISDKKSSVYYIEEDLATLHYAMSLKKSSPMNKVINRKIDQLLQAGIIQKFEKERFGSLDRVEKSDHEEVNQMLTLEHLGICFVAIMMLLALSCVVFVIECAVGHVKRILVEAALN